MKPTMEAGHRYGGHLSEYPKPWQLKYGEVWSEPRELKVHSHVWGTSGYSLGGNGHHHAEIREDDNLIWVDEGDRGLWGQPWGWKENPEMHQVLKGRYEINVDFIRKKDVIRWAVSILKEWRVLGNKQYKITWDLDDDDPLADVILAREMRKRAERND